MAATKMKIKKDKSGGHVVMVLVKHPMETGNRKDKKTGKKVPAHYVKTMVFTHNGAAVAQAIRYLYSGRTIRVRPAALKRQSSNVDHGKIKTTSGGPSVSRRR